MRLSQEIRELREAVGEERAKARRAAETAARRASEHAAQENAKGERDYQVSERGRGREGGGVRAIG